MLDQPMSTAPSRQRGMLVFPVRACRRTDGKTILPMPLWRDNELYDRLMTNEQIRRRLAFEADVN